VGVVAVMTKAAPAPVASVVCGLRVAHALAMGGPVAARGLGEHGRSPHEEDRQQRGEDEERTQTCHAKGIASARAGL